MASLQWKTSAVLQISSGAVSFICSSSLAYMIKAKGLKKNPYRRLIFGISVADIMQSLSMMLGPIMVDSSVPMAFWGLGNKHTCRLNGLLFTFGNVACPMYSCGLSIYYYCKLYKKMTNERFARNVERWMHAIIISFTVATNGYALASNFLNTSITGTYCVYAVLPTGCRQRPDLFGECSSSPDPESVKILVLVTMVFLQFVCLVIAILLLALLLWKIVASERIFSSKVLESQQEKNRNESSTPKATEENIQSSGLVQKQSVSLRSQSSTNRDEDQVSGDTMAGAYRQEMMAQLILYSITFFLSYFLYILGQLLVLLFQKIPTKTHLIIGQFLFPLQGLFNMLIFIRPAVRVTRLRRPGTSWLKGYYLVIKNGGEAVAGSQPFLAPTYKTPSSVKFGVENPAPNEKNHLLSFQDASNECMYVDSSQELSRNNAAYNSSEEWHYVRGGSTDEIIQDPENAIAGIHHNDLDAIVEDSKEVSEDESSIGKSMNETSIN